MDGSAGSAGKDMVGSDGRGRRTVGSGGMRRRGADSSTSDGEVGALHMKQLTTVDGGILAGDGWKMQGVLRLCGPAWPSASQIAPDFQNSFNYLLLNMSAIALGRRRLHHIVEKIRRPSSFCFWSNFWYSIDSRYPTTNNKRRGYYGYVNELEGALVVYDVVASHRFHVALRLTLRNQA